MLLTTYKGAAQYAVPCTNLGLEAVHLSEPPECAGSDKCGKEYFQIKLVTRNGYAVPPAEEAFDLIYYQLTVTAILDITHPSSGGLSRINNIQTLNCHGETAFAESAFSVEEVDGVEIVSFDLLNEEDDGPEIIFTWDDVANRWECNLFVVAVDGFAEEKLTVAPVDGIYRSAAPGSPGSITCAPIMIVSTSGPVTIESPEEMDKLCLEFDSYNSTTHLLPVIAVSTNANTTVINQLMFSFTIDASNLMESPELVGLASNMTGLLKPIPGTTDWQGTIFYDPPSSPLSVAANGTTTLFYIKLVGPVNTSEAASAVFEFGSGTIRTTIGGGASSACSDICIGSSTTVNFPGYAGCGSSSPFTFIIKGVESNLSVCDQLDVQIELEWDEEVIEESSLDFDQILFTVEFDMSDGVTIDDIADNTFGCPANPQCLPTNGFTNCFKIDGNKVSFCFFPGSAESVDNHSSFIIHFDVEEGCISSTVVKQALVDLAGESPCVPMLEMTETFPLCPPRFSGSILDELGQPAPNLDLDISSSASPSCNSYAHPVSDGLFSFCACAEVTDYKVTPEALNNDWLNGVTTYDLVLINKHILGLELLDSPYKIIAADANKSNDVTTFDIVSIRKLILGIAASFPAGNNSWRYITADHVFSNPTNPWSSAFPENWGGTPPASDIDFIAVKIGDVNNSHTADDIPGMPRIGVQPIGIGKTSKRTDEFVTMPITYEGTEALTALQLGLQFDAGNWELLEPSTADLPDFEPGCFNLQEADKGRIKFVWFTPWPKEQLQQGRTLFYLTFRRKSADAGASPDLRTDDKVLENAGFLDSGLAFELKSIEIAEERRQLATAPVSGWSVVCAPNPVIDAATLRIQSPVQQAMSVWVFNALGIRTYYKEITAPAGTTEVSIPEVAGWPAGIYTWKVKSGREKQQGLFIRR